MQILDISESRSYATKANLLKATVELDAFFDKKMEEERKYNLIRKLVVMNEAGRWTAVYYFNSPMTYLVMCSVEKGFMSVG